MRGLSSLRFAVRRRLPWPVDVRRSTESGGAVTFRCLGQSIVFRPEHGALEPHPDAVLAAWWLPLAWQGLELRLDSPPDPELCGHTGAIAALMERWWRLRPAWSAGGQSTAARRDPAAAVALCFSCGVDSFYSLFFAMPRPGLLLGVGGYDLPLAGAALLAARRRALEDVAAARDLAVHWVETNLRDHSLYRAAPWDRLSHGPALVAVAMMLRSQIGELILSSSYHRSNLHPFGSHPDLDPLWSTSYLRVRHFDDAIWRSDKLVRLVDDPEAWPLVSRHLQVCWQAPVPGGNCGRCEKCVRLRLTLWTQRRGARVATLPLESEGELAAALRCLGSLPTPALIPPYERFRGCGSEVERALEEVLRASRDRWGRSADAVGERPGNGEDGAAG